MLNGRGLQPNTQTPCASLLELKWRRALGKTIKLAFKVQKFGFCVGCFHCRRLVERCGCRRHARYGISDLISHACASRRRRLSTCSTPSRLAEIGGALRRAACIPLQDHLGEHELPELCRTRAEPRRAGEQIVVPHAVEAFAVVGSKTRPGLFETPVPRHQGAVVCFINIVLFL
jgi:hypothetical protein